MRRAKDAAAEVAGLHVMVACEFEELSKGNRTKVHKMHGEERLKFMMAPS